MKRIIIATALGMASFACAAQSDLLVGEFGHEFTKKPGTPVWAITGSNNQYWLDSLGDEEPPAPAHEYSESERRKFWGRMLWSEETSAAARCIGNDAELICYVPPKTRSAIDWLKNRQSDYFYYDTMMGVMEIQKLPK
ncbi:MAG: hypothetical protein LBV44_09100 [Methylobacillus sp.]|jgi:hypothetical protein|nr:hypothetical protein [Methylobacillus sp.]